MPNSQKNLYKKFLGDKGELIALNYIKKNGYKILEKNYKTKFGEADIIAKKDDLICFIEVKTRTNLIYGEGNISIDINLVCLVKRLIIKSKTSTGLLQTYIYMKIICKIITYRL